MRVKDHNESLQDWKRRSQEALHGTPSGMRAAEDEGLDTGAGRANGGKDVCDWNDHTIRAFGLGGEISLNRDGEKQMLRSREPLLCDKQIMWGGRGPEDNVGP